MPLPEQIAAQKKALKHTARGFAYREFVDHYGHKCSLQKSSLATEDCIWFGVDNPKLMKCVQNEGWKEVPIPEGASIIPHRMHLTQEMVKDLLPVLRKFVKTGEVE